MNESLGFEATVWNLVGPPMNFRKRIEKRLCRIYVSDTHLLNEYPLWVPVFDIKASSRMN